ncbi:MAG: Ig-like domain-containing protein, partial [Bacteroidales bacterium]
PNAVPVANDDERGTNYQTDRYVDVLFNDKGLEDGGIILKIITAPVNGTAVITADSILYSPALGFSGISTFEYSVTDKHGDGDTAWVTITVLPEGVENHIPIAVNDTVETFINTPININVLANDTLLDGFSDLNIYSDPSFGSVIVNTNRTITYIPSNLFKGIDSFEYWVEDIQGDYDIATVIIDVTESPDALPVAVDDARGTEYQTMVSVDVLTNDKGLNDKPVLLSIESDPAQGTTTINADRIEFIPANGFAGLMTFEYRVTDKDGDFDVAKVTITVKNEGEINYIPVAVNDSIETMENTPVDINVLANDSGLEDGFRQIIIFDQPEFGSVMVNPNRSITYQPSPWFIGTEEFVYWVEDLDGDYDTARVVVHVDKPGNHLPDAFDDARGTNFDTPVSVDVLTNDKGLEDGEIVVSVETSPAQGSVTIVNNEVIFTPESGFTGKETFSYRVTDKEGDFDIANVLITVKEDGVVNHIPVAVNDTSETIENTSVIINILANDVGLDDGFGKILIFTEPLFGSVIVNANRTITYTPANAYIGSDSLVYWVEDVDGDYDMASVFIDVVVKPDYQPIAIDDTRGCEFESTRTVDVLTNDTGLDDAPVLVTVTVAPNATEGTTMVNADNTITFTAATGFSGITTFRYTVTDNDGDSDDAQVTITVLGEGETNHIPVAVNDTVSTIVNTSINISVLANDTIKDNFGRLILHHAPQFGTAVVTGRTIVYTPSNMFIGTDQFDYWVEDVHGDYSIASVVIEVTDKPDYQPVANDDARGCEYESTRTVDVLTNDSGLDDAPVLVTVTVEPSAAEGVAMVNADNTIAFTAAKGFSGTTTFRYTVMDNDGDSDDAQVTITVLGEGETNHIPVAVNDTVSTIVNTLIDISVLANDTIKDSFGRLLIHQSPQFGTAVVTGRTIVYTPSNMFVGVDQFDYWVEDVHGDYSIASVVIEVTDKPDYQPVANDDARGCEYESTRTVDVLTNDTGLDDAPVLVTVTVAPNASEGTTMVNADNTITFTAATGFSGTTTFRYTVTDNDGESDDAQVTITVLGEGETNHIPVAVDDDAITIENNAVDINVLANDTDLDDGIQSVVIFRTSAFGNVTVNADYTVTYVPSPYFVGIDEFEYLVSDVHGDNDIAKVTVDVRAISNNIPVANDDSRGTSLNTDVIVDVLANDTGLEDGGIVVSLVSNPSNGTIVVNLDNTVTYTPNTGFMGTDQFEYQVCDLNNDCDTATVTINVKEINYNPLAVDDKYYIGINSAKTINVLDNDSGLEDGGIEVEILTQVMVGQTIVNEDNTITYNPLTGFEGVDYFAYKVTDVDGDYDIAMVTVHVTSGPLPGATITYAGNTNENGKEVLLSIVLNTEPSADVSIELKSEDLTEATLSYGRITFTSTNWLTPQVVSVTGEDDHLIDGDISYRVLANNMVSTDQVYSGLNVESITLINEDNDVANIILAISDYNTSEDTENTQFTLELAAEPVSEVSISIINSDITEGFVEPENVVFTPENWNVKQTITVTGLDDDLKDGDIQYELSFAVTSTDNQYDMFSMENLQLTNIDNDGKFGLVIPEAFSPDNDGYNDNFEILGLEKYSKVSMKIYNRWGNLVYSENSYQNNWDGKANAIMAVGKELPTGTYFYIITIRDINKEMSGSIFLKR